MFAQYDKKYPKNKPKFTVMANEADALGKFQQGVNWDIFRPYVGWVRYFAESGLVQPWDTKLIPNFKHLNPLMVKAGQYKGKQYGIPEDWGFDAVLYRSDKVKPKARSWGLLFDERYKGKIAWYDDGSTMLPMTGLYLRFKDPWNQTDAQLKQAQKFLISKKHLVRTIWSSETALWQAFGSGDLWIAYAWPNDWVQMRKKPKPGLPVVYMMPREKPLAWVGMLMLLKDSLAPQARARVRRCLEFRRKREVARGQLRLRSREPSREAVVERSLACSQDRRPERPRAAQRVHRPPHPAAGCLREGVGRSEVGLRGSR